MPVINKAPKATIWAVIAIALVGSAVSFKISWTLPIMAAFGGIVVFRGLWIEQRADEALEKIHPEPQRVRSIKRISNVGWWILMAGILAEIITAGALAARDVYEEWENRPENRPITDLMASMYIEIRGQNEPDLANPIFNGSLAKVFVGDASSFDTLYPMLTADHFVRGNAQYNLGNRSYWLRFDDNGMLGFLARTGNARIKVKQIANSACLYATFRFLTNGAEMLGGDAVIVANGTVSYVFHFPQQVPFRQFTNSPPDAPLWFVATNCFNP